MIITKERKGPSLGPFFKDRFIGFRLWKDR